MNEERLQKYLARAGVASRRKSEALIEQGQVTVNGRVAKIGQKVKPRDAVRVHGELIRDTVPTVTYALHKPVGFISTAADERGRKTVMELVPEVPGLHPVGRLDRDSEGLLLLTTDGDLTLRLTHPRYQHEKAYRVWCARGAVSADDLRRLRQGIRLEDGLAKAREVHATDNGCRLVLTEGRNRQIRRMLGALGYTVTRLLRERIDGVKLGDMPPGAYRKLSPQELGQLEPR